jgi:PAS domain S-box-containing protein
VQLGRSCLLPSGKFSWLALSVASLLTALLLFFVVEIPSPATSLKLSNLLQTAIVIWAAFFCYCAAKRSSGYLRQLWMLLTSALALASAAQGLETYYQSFAHVPTLTPRFSDILFILWVTPAIMMFLPRPAEESDTIDWQQVLDFAQIGVVAITAYLYFFYIPSRWEAEGPQMVLKIIRLQLLRDATLAAAFLLRATTVSDRSIRVFFGRMAGLFFLASVSEFLFLLAPDTSPTRGRWTDVVWCAPYLFATLFAATWHREEEPSARKPISPIRVMIVSQILPILIPLLVVFMGRRIAAEQITLAWIAVTASFILSAGRLLLTNEKQRRIANHLLQTQQALRRSEQMFFTAFRSSPDAVGISAIPGGQFLEVNDSFTHLTGYLHEETLGRTPLELKLWRDPSHRAQIMAKLQEKLEVREEEFLCQTKSGETRVCQFSGMVIELDGKPCALVIVRDITARKEAEEALRASEVRFRNLVQDLHVGVILLGPDEEIEFANRAALMPFGLTEEEIIGKTVSDFSGIALREGGIEVPFSMLPGAIAIATKRPVRNEVVGWRRTDSNEVLWTLVDAVPHLSPDGKVTSVLLSISNITQRIQAEEALRASEERFRTLVREMNVGVVLHGPGAEIQFANQAAQRMFDIPLEQAVGKTSGELNLISFREDGTEIPFFMRPGPRTIRTGQSIKDEVIGWRRPGSGKVLWTLGNVAPQLNREGIIVGLISTFTDITERRRVEDALHQLSTRLLQLQDEERRRLGRELHDSLAQSVLAVNLNLAQALQSSDSLSERTRRVLAEARRLLQEMSQEIRTLSYLLHPPLLDQLGLVSAIKEYAEGFSQRSGIALELDLPAGFGRLPQDVETALFRIVQESLSNIQRHSGSEAAKISLRGDTANLRLEVSDQGRGMGSSNAEKGNGRGARLGVGILGMRERMTQLGGTLDINSSPSGTMVRATIPLRAEVSDAGSHPRR